MEMPSVCTLGVRWGAGLYWGVLPGSKASAAEGLSQALGVQEVIGTGEESEWFSWTKCRAFCSLSSHTQVILVSVL